MQTGKVKRVVLLPSSFRLLVFFNMILSRHDSVYRESGSD